MPAAWVDPAAALVVGFAAWVGWRRGTVPMTLAVIGMLGGYLGAALFYRPFGVLAERLFQLPALLAMPLGGMVALLVVSLVLRAVTWKINRAIAIKRAAGWYPSRANRAGGAALGALWTATVVVAAAWFCMALRGLTHRGPEIGGTLTGRVSVAVTHRVVYGVLRHATTDPLAANFGAFMISDPGRGLADARALGGDMRVRRLLTDATLRGALARGDLAVLEGSAAVHALAEDSLLHRAAAETGFISGDPGVQAVASDWRSAPARWRGRSRPCAPTRKCSG